MKITSFPKLLLAVAVIAIVVWSCRKNEVEHRSATSINYYYTYFPLRIGATYIYRIDSQVYNTFKGKYDTSLTYLKEVIDSPFLDNTGMTTYKVFRWYTKDTTLGWSNERVWTEKRTQSEAQRWEENIRYVRLYFPVAANYAWNGNRYNTIDSFKEFNYYYKEVHVPFTLSGIKYDSTVYVSEANYLDALENHTEGERYAAKVGLIYREGLDTFNYGNGLYQGSYFFKQTLLQYTP